MRSAWKFSNAKKASKTMSTIAVNVNEENKKEQKNI